MSDQLKRLASGLRGMKLDIALGQKSNKGREVTVTKLSDGAPKTTTAKPPLKPPVKKKVGKGASKKKAKRE